MAHCYYKSAASLQKWCYKLQLGSFLIHKHFFFSINWQNICVLLAKLAIAFK